MSVKVCFSTYKSYDIRREHDGSKTLSCRVHLRHVGWSRELPTIKAAKDWIVARDALPPEKREPMLSWHHQQS